jgi:hypothetical protein
VLTVHPPPATTNEQECVPRLRIRDA